MKITRGHHISFIHAFDGLMYSFRTQPNFRVHFYFTILALFLGYYLQISRFEWLVLLLTIFLVFTIELINTSIEAATDLIITSRNPVAKAAKDSAAAAVLIIALCSLVVGYSLFFDRLVALFIR